MKSIKQILSPILAIHQRILESNVNDLAYPRGDINPYQVFLEWLLELVQYGVLIEIVYALAFNGFHWMSFARILLWGLVRWIWLDIVKETSKSIRGK